MTITNEAWRDPRVVLDAAALLPNEVEREARSNHFTSMASELLSGLTSRLVSADELRSSLQSLADVAGALGAGGGVEPPGPEASADATGEMLRWSPS